MTNTPSHLQLVPVEHCGRLLRRREKLAEASAKVWQTELEMQQAFAEETTTPNISVVR